MRRRLPRFVKRLLIVSAFAVDAFAGRPIAPATLADDPARTTAVAPFEGSKAGDEREVCGVRLCWCPPGKFLMGSPPGELERRRDEDQVEVTLTKGSWTAKYETTQGLWKRV